MSDDKIVITARLYDRPAPNARPLIELLKMGGGLGILIHEKQVLRLDFEFGESMPCGTQEFEMQFRCLAGRFVLVEPVFRRHVLTAQEQISGIQRGDRDLSESRLDCLDLRKGWNSKYRHRKNGMTRVVWEHAKKNSQKIVVRKPSEAAAHSARCSSRARPPSEYWCILFPCSGIDDTRLFLRR